MLFLLCHWILHLHLIFFSSAMMKFRNYYLLFCSSSCVTFLISSTENCDNADFTNESIKRLIAVLAAMSLYVKVWNLVSSQVFFLSPVLEPDCIVSYQTWHQRGEGIEEKMKKIREKREISSFKT